MRALILGGAGFLGSNVVRRCVDEGADVVVVDSLEQRLSSTIDNLRDVYDRIRFIRGSILDPGLLDEIVRESSVIFHCAAQSSHPISLDDPIYDAEINCLGTLRVLESMRRSNRDAVIVYPSSSTVVGKALGRQIDEEHGERPLEIYSANKGAAEKYHRIYHEVHGLRTVVIRLPNLYGPFGKGLPEFGFVNYFIELAMRGDELRVFGDGHQTRNLLYVEDAVDAMWRSAFDERLHGGLFFAAHPRHWTVAEVANAIVDVFGSGNVVHVPWPETLRRVDVESVTISSERFERLTGWKARYSLEEGLRRTREILAARVLR